MKIAELIKKHPLILMEAAVVERIRRAEGVELDIQLSNTPLIYHKKGKEVLEEIYSSYINVAKKQNIPFLMCAPTWRANQDRVKQSKFKHSINQDALSFMKTIKDNHHSMNIFVGGMMGPKNDCYKPEEALGTEEAMLFHKWQAKALTDGKADFIMAQTLPNVKEALGIAKAIEKTSTPYFISFVISKDGKVLDGTPLDEAINQIDAHTENKPMGYFVNCSYPSFIDASMGNPILIKRLIGILANASSLSHDQLDGAKELKADSVSDWGKSMLHLNDKLKVSILGGCCGTNEEHLSFLTERIE